PIIYNRRLYVFWLVLTEKAADPEFVPDDPTTQDPSPPAKRLQIQLVWTILENGQWSAKKAASKIIHSKVRAELESGLTLKATVDTDKDELHVLVCKLGIHADPAKVTFELLLQGWFVWVADIVFNGCSTEPQVPDDLTPVPGLDLLSGGRSHVDGA